MDTQHLHLAPVPPTPGGPTVGEQAIHIVLADDHALMRRTLRLLLEGEENIEVIAEVDDLGSLASRVDAGLANVLVLDLGMLNGSSSDVIRQLRERRPQMQIVIVTMEENPVFAQRARDAGAVGFVLKDLADEELVEAIRLAVRGEAYVSPRLTLPLRQMQRAVAEDELTVREVEVLRLIALGHTSVEIAGRLKLSPRTIETHRARILRKVGLATRAELVAYALRRGLLRL